MKQIGIQRQCTGLEAFDDALRGRARSCGAPGDEQGKKMLFGRMRARRVRRAVAIMSQGIGIARDEALLQPTRKGIDITQRFLRRGEDAQSRRLWVACPDPMIRMPSSASGRSAFP